MGDQAAAVVVSPHAGSCGATVTGVALATLDEAAFAVVQQAWHTYGVLAFPGQYLAEVDQVAFSRRIGALENTDLRRGEHGSRPTTLTLANINRRGQLVSDPNHKLNQFLRGNQEWHSDSSFKRISAKASMLVALEVPEVGGETEFTDMRAAYDALDEATQRRIAAMVAVHSAAYSQHQAMPDAPLNPEEEQNLPPVRQPLVRVHEPTGRRSLFVGRHARVVEGLGDVESRTLLDALLEGACQPPRVYSHRWSAGDAVLWDNRCMLHRGRPWDSAKARIMRRTTIAGDAPAGTINEWALAEQ